MVAAVLFSQSSSWSLVCNRVAGVGPGPWCLAPSRLASQGPSRPCSLICLRAGLLPLLLGGSVSDSEDPTPR